VFLLGTFRAKQRHECVCVCVCRNYYRKVTRDSLLQGMGRWLEREKERERELLHLVYSLDYAPNKYRVSSCSTRHVGLIIPFACFPSRSSESNLPSLDEEISASFPTRTRRGPAISRIAFRNPSNDNFALQTPRTISHVNEQIMYRCMINLVS